MIRTRDLLMAVAAVLPPTCAQAADVSASPPTPPVALTSLARAFTGRWSITETFEPMNKNPDAISTPGGGMGHGEEVYRSGPGGFTFMEEEHNYAPTGQAFIVGYMWWDKTKDRLAGMECNSQWPQGCDLQGALTQVSLSWDGQQLVVDFKNPKDPGKLVWHEVFSNITATTFLHVGYVGQPDGSLKKWVTIHATRASNQP
jgi:hypothetical protein